MDTPSRYELDAWSKVQDFNLRPLSGTIDKATDQLTKFGSNVANATSQFIDERPKLKTVTDGISARTQQGAAGIANGARTLLQATPGLDSKVVKNVGSNITTTVGKLSRAGLSPQQVVRRHQKLRHTVSSLQDLKSLDLEQIDRVRGRTIGYSYPAAAALTGMATGFAITGTQAFSMATAGAGAAPGFAVVSGAMAADAATILSLSSRVIGHTALIYGYDPEDPVEKLYQLSVLNLSTAGTQAAKSAAWRDISRLSQNLYRNKTWKELDKAVLTRVVKAVAERQGHDITKKLLGKVIPVVSIVTGGVTNWATLERISDTAEVTYRRRFLLEKYPHLETQEAKPRFVGDGEASNEDDVFSVLEVAEEILKSEDHKNS